MVDAANKPQILEHLSKSLNHTIFDIKWIPSSAKFVCLGSYPRDTGAFEIYALKGPNLVKIAEYERKDGIKCGTFGASGLTERHLATGSFTGRLQIWDMERSDAPLYDVRAHASITNCIDGCGGQAKGYGAPELVTGGRDGCVRVWDVRQDDAPVATFKSSNKDMIRDCWTVAFGNSYNDKERCVIAGYDNGDIKLFDLRMNKVRWEANVGNGVCAVQFDRKDIKMNKVSATCLESQFHIFDARTQHKDKGFASVTEMTALGATIWGNMHLPQNRDVSMICAGDGTLYLYKYHYPDQRRVKDPDQNWMGVAGSVELLNSKSLSDQPIGAFDWNPDKTGLFACSSLDQCIRVGMVTKLNIM